MTYHFPLMARSLSFNFHQYVPLRESDKLCSPRKPFCISLKFEVNFGMDTRLVSVTLHLGEGKRSRQKVHIVAFYISKPDIYTLFRVSFLDKVLPLSVLDKNGNTSLLRDISPTECSSCPRCQHLAGHATSAVTIIKQDNVGSAGCGILNQIHSGSWWD